MALLPALAIGAGLGLLKNVAVDAPRERRDRRLAAETQRYSPWTGLMAQPIRHASPFGNILQGGMTGALLGAQLDAAAPAASAGASADASSPWSLLAQKPQMAPTLYGGY